MNTPRAYSLDNEGRVVIDLLAENALLRFYTEVEGDAGWAHDRLREMYNAVCAESRAATLDLAPVVTDNWGREMDYLYAARVVGADGKETSWCYMAGDGSHVWVRTYTR